MPVTCKKSRIHDLRHALHCSATSRTKTCLHGSQNATSPAEFCEGRQSIAGASPAAFIADEETAFQQPSDVAQRRVRRAFRQLRILRGVEVPLKSVEQPRGCPPCIPAHAARNRDSAAVIEGIPTRETCVRPANAVRCSPSAAINPSKNGHRGALFDSRAKKTSAGCFFLWTPGDVPKTFPLPATNCFGSESRRREKKQRGEKST